MTETAAQLADKAWNPIVHACQTGKASLLPETLAAPQRWRKPRRVRVDSEGDLFGVDVPFDVIDQVVQSMFESPRHVFLVLTKRPDRAEEYVWWRAGRSGFLLSDRVLPPNMWLGVPAQTQKMANDLVPQVLEVPAAVRFALCEPLLSPVDLSFALLPGRCPVCNTYPGAPVGCSCDKLHGVRVPARLDWVVAGGETGPSARPMHPDWARSLRNQCVEARVPFLLTGHGEWLPADEHMRGMWPERANGKVIAREWWPRHDWADGLLSFRVGRRRAGRRLDGKVYNEYPEVLPT